MKDLSIFVDESGDFGKVDNNSPYYLVTFIFHDQSNSIEDDLFRLNSELKNKGNINYIHTGPIIRRETPYHNMTIDERRSYLYKMRMFFLHLPITHTTIKINRKEANDPFALTAQISKKIKMFVDNHIDFFTSYDRIIVYYDNGQHELNIILNSILNSILSNVEFRKASPGEYRLLQIADYVCSIELLAIKSKEKRLSKSEQAFFYKPQELKKSFIKSIHSKELN